MKSKPSGKRANDAAITTEGMILQTWQLLGSSSVGRRELLEIQTILRRELGEGAMKSPAAIARVLADNGADLRHPEIIQCDSEWREHEIERDDDKFKPLAGETFARPLSLIQARDLIDKLEKLRIIFEESGDVAALKRLRSVAMEARKAAETLAQDRKADGSGRLEQAEVAEWLAIWIQTPTLFADWLELRQRSDEFVEKFRGKDH
jgi:hypothetical protein